MMEQVIIKICRVISIGFLMLLFSCLEMEQFTDSQEDTVELSLSLNVAPEATQTKAVIDPENPEELSAASLIKNFWVIQYNGVSDDAIIVGEPVYYVYSEWASSDRKIKLIPSVSENTVVILANTFDPTMTFPQNSTLRELKNKWKEVTGPESLFAVSGDDKYIMFNGISESVINEQTAISCELKRNIARVKITVKNSSNGEVEITDWQLKQVPVLSHYVNNYALPDKFPSEVSVGTTDYPIMDPEDLTPSADGSYTFTTYLPVNKKGTAPVNTNPGYKNRYAPVSATCFQINGTYKDEDNDDLPISYVFYLGEDMISDFNILPNHSYEYVFEIKGKGNAQDDHRVKDWGVVDFANADDEIANCYVINPATVEYNRKFRIPVKRVDEFWGNNGYENNQNYTLGGASPKAWKVKVLVSNFDIQDKLVFTKDTGTGIVDSQNDLEYFEFSVAPGTVGNAVVAIYLADDTQYATPLWSWHLWITDYAPDEAFNKHPEDEVYKYPVTGGEVHRYDNGIWDGEYAKRFIMDRDLGAPNNHQYLDAGNGSCYYQFGRKDPFFGHNSTIKEGSFGVQSYNTIENDVVQYSVLHPLVFISSDKNYWTDDEKYNPTSVDKTVLWQDPYTSSNKYGDTALKKSLFDPCPPGYCVPIHGTYADIKTQQKSKPTTNNFKNGSMIRNFKELETSGFVISYWPYPESGSPDNVPDVPIYFPVTGYKNSERIVSLSDAIPPYAIYSTASQFTQKRSYRKTIKYNLEDGGEDNNKWWGHTLRCVTVRDSN